MHKNDLYAKISLSYRKSCLVVDFRSDVTNREIQLFHWSLLENPVSLKSSRVVTVADFIRALVFLVT